MKVSSSLKNLKLRHPNCQVVRRKGRMYVLNKTHPRYKARGRSTTGEKTMLDAMVPALETMKEQQSAGADTKKILEAGVAAAQAGVEATKPMVATKGRASYLGERSIGHQDPGATSFTLMLQVIAQAYE